MERSRVKDNPLPSSFLQFLLGAACTAIILWGIRAASEVLGPLLLGLLLAYAILPFPQWLMRRFKMSKRTAIVITAISVLCLGPYLLFALDLATVRISEKLPEYEVHLASLYQQATNFSSAHGIVAPSLSVESVFTPERLREITRVLLPEAGVIISHGMLIFLLAFLFVIEMLGDVGAKLSPLAQRLAVYGSDVRS